jgi:hypothetical protein
MKLQLVEITWIDADGESGWTEYDPSKKLVEVKTFGLLVNRNWRKSDHIAHADTWCPETKHWSGLGRIPKGMVKRVKVITTVEV